MSRRVLPTLACVPLLAIACTGDDTADAGTASVLDAQVSARCPEDTPEFAATSEAGLLARGKNDLVQARVIAAEPAMPERFENDWTVRFTDPEGMPLDDVEIADACVFMPVHGHGGVPGAVVATAEPGTFDLQGLNLFMRGPWEVQLAVNTASGEAPASEVTSCARDRPKPGADLVLFRVCVQDD